MGFRLLNVNMPTDYTPGELRGQIGKKLRLGEFSYAIERQSLDARDKGNIYWQVHLCVSSPALAGPEPPVDEPLHIPFQKRAKKVLVVGSGPAGFFCAYTLLLAGFSVTIFEQGPEVGTRSQDIAHFETGQALNEKSNYAFGEGGAGTFSDGKLTCRTKTISKERRFIFENYIRAGAPAEIAYLAHPHLGSDNLVEIVKNLRLAFLTRGGDIRFNTEVNDLVIKDGHVKALCTDQGQMEDDYAVMAAGNSAYRTLRLLIRHGVPFRVKPFALGCRVEHPQETINRAQWGRPSLPGLKAAEYRLTHPEPGEFPVYTFCMCPGGKVVPSAAYHGLNVVNGKSDYFRDQPLGNAAVVAAFHPGQILKRDLEPLQALDWLESLERKFYDFSSSYAAPACKIADFLQGTVSASLPPASYPFSVIAADFSGLLPVEVCSALKAGMKHFDRRLKGFSSGLMLGLESKTSSLLQAELDENGRCPAIENLYICGEGSGHAGGIISSAAHGIKAALAIIRAAS